MSNVITITRPTAKTVQTTLAKASYLTGVMVGTSKRIAKTSATIIKQDYNVAKFNLKNW